MKTPLFLVLSAAVLASACSDKTSNETSTAPAAVNAPAVTGSASIAFKNALLAIAANSYGGTCVSMPARTPVAATIDIKPSGEVSSRGASASVLDPDTRLSLTRTFGAAGGPAAVLHAGGPGPFGVSIDTQGDGGGASRFGVKEEGTMCTGVPQAAALKDKSVFAALEKFIVPAVRDLSCSRVEKGLPGAAPVPLQFAIENGVGNIGADAFSFQSGMARESAEVDAIGHLSYTLDTADARSLRIGLDDQGKLTSLMVTAGSALTSCYPQ